MITIKEEMELWAQDVEQSHDEMIQNILLKEEAIRKILKCSEVLSTFKNSLSIIQETEGLGDYKDAAGQHHSALMLTAWLHNLDLGDVPSGFHCPRSYWEWVEKFM